MATRQNTALGALAPAPRREVVTEETISSWPDRYGLTVRGDCMAPGIPDGASVIVNKTAPLEVCHLVVLWFRPEHVQDGAHQAQIKRLYLAVPWGVKFPHKDHPKSEVIPVLIVKADSTGKTYSIPCSALLAVHRCEGLMEKPAA